MTTICSISARDVRFRLREGEGTDAVHSTSTYAYAVVELHTDAGLVGSGLAFTLGAGTDLVCRAALRLSGELRGRRIEEVMAELGHVSHRMANHPQLRWLGPDKGVVSLALAAVVNACWDLFCKARGQPLWEVLLALSPSELAAAVDWSGLEDALTREAAVAMLEARVEGRKERLDALGGRYPGYDTSFGWIGLSDEQVRAGAIKAKEAGFRALKLKVGSSDPERDVRRALMVRGAIGDDMALAVDVNQQWSLPMAVEMCKKLEPARLLWVEEPCHPDDVRAHAALHDATGVPVAVGEAIPNRVLFKNFLCSGACQVAQLDPTRQAGVSECLAIALLAAQCGVKLTHHVGDMGMIAQHMMPFYRVALGVPEGTFLEHIDHLNRYLAFAPRVEGGSYVLSGMDAGCGASTQLLSNEELEALGGCSAVDVHDDAAAAVEHAPAAASSSSSS